MSCTATKSAACLGFLTIVENAELGLAGGYLLLNAAGRPLEFHCTAPVKPTRTQEILYGPTLKPFLYGEQIGQTLLAKSKLTPVVVCTDSEAVLAARDFSDIPIVLVLDSAGGLSGDADASALAAAFPLAKCRVVTAARYAGDQQTIRDAWLAQADHLDLREPFTRIREAVEEALRSARQAA
jgi:hypothetical protein